MNPIKCEACGHDVSPAAAACANCGHPLPKQKRLGCAIAAFVVGIIGIVTITIATHYGEENQRQEKANPTCRSDYLKCADNKDVVEHYRPNGTSMGALCRMAAQDAAKYGSPTFPLVPFGDYSNGRTYLDSATATLIEKQATFKNGFGADERVSVICRYDLKADHAAIEIVQN